MLVVYVVCRWWSQPVSALNLRGPLTVHPDVSVQDALRLLSREGFDQVPVVDETGYVKFHESYCRATCALSRSQAFKQGHVCS